MVHPSIPCSSAPGSKQSLGLSKMKQVLKGNMKAVLGTEASSTGMQWFQAQRSKVEKYFAPFNFQNMSSTIGMGQTTFLMTLLSAQ